VKLKLPLTKVIITLKVMINFANHFHTAKYGDAYQLNLSETN